MKRCVTQRYFATQSQWLPELAAINA
ncbi:hypothetical protein DSM3645_18401 [Blastopirellula marina DSM 3645]|uniref:Uncharacterized protein n=1 Tax=Blastopirellula marina DSM 3645 TaxID=314230 RepID=A3ZYX4_9BACT|nr:hypothetical protein DSM3645_18401 [Blastopirellula marina DSM 3645]